MIWRVRGRGEFAALACAPRVVRGPLAVRVRCRPVDEPPRVAFAIGRPVGSAVVRNRVRRRLRAALAASPELLRSGCSYLVAARPAAATLSCDDLTTTLRACLRAAGSTA